MKPRTIDLPHLSDLDNLCTQIIENLQQRQILLLNGEMASGKTTFVGALVRLLEGKDFSSPTYAIHQSYTTPRVLVDHLDLYRLKNDADLESTGFWELFEKNSGLIVIEWADRLEGHWWPSGWSVMSLDFSIENEKRKVILSEL